MARDSEVALIESVGSVALDRPDELALSLLTT
jgi:hypothetical protein